MCTTSTNLFQVLSSLISSHEQTEGISKKQVCVLHATKKGKERKRNSDLFGEVPYKTKRETMRKADFNHPDFWHPQQEAPLDPMRKSVGGMLFGMLLVFEVTSLLRKSDEVREDHAAKADMVERYDRIGLNVFGMIIIQWSLDKILGVARCYHGLDMRRHVLHFHPPDLVEKFPHRHFQIEERRWIEMWNPKPEFGR